MARNDDSLLLRLPTSLKEAIEMAVGKGSVSDFIRSAVERDLSETCKTCHGTGKVVRSRRRRM